MAGEPVAAARRSFTLFAKPSINFLIVVYAECHASPWRLALNQLWDIGGIHGQEGEEGESEEGKEESRQEVVSLQ